jgi:hypothetical protein
MENPMRKPAFDKLSKSLALILAAGAWTAGANAYGQSPEHIASPNDDRFIAQPGDIAAPSLQPHDPHDVLGFRLTRSHKRAASPMRDAGTRKDASHAPHHTPWPARPRWKLFTIAQRNTAQPAGDVINPPIKNFANDTHLKRAAQLGIGAAFEIGESAHMVGALQLNEFNEPRITHKDADPAIGAYLGITFEF